MALFDGPPLHDFPDRAFRELLKNLANLEELLTAAAPEPAACLDCSQAVLLDRGFVLEDWRERESDLLFRIPLRTPEPDRSALVCVLLEHQSGAMTPCPCACWFTPLCTGSANGKPGKTGMLTPNLCA